MLPANNIRQPPLAAIRAFESAARLGSFERASVELNVTPSAVGKRIASLEGFVGVRLLDRSKGGVRPTAAGLEYAEQVRQALRLLSAISLHRRPERRIRTLQICVPPTFARKILVPNLADFEAHHPDIELDIILSVPYLELRPPGAQVEILANRRPGPGIEILSDESMSAVCAPAYAQRLGLASPADLQRATLIRCPLEPWMPWFAAANLDWPEPARGIRFVDSGMAISAATSSLGVALARPSLCRQSLLNGELISLFDVHSSPTTRYSLQINDGAIASDAIGDAAAAFGRWLSGVCAHVAAESRRGPETGK